MKEVRLKMVLKSGYPIAQQDSNLNIVPGIFALVIEDKMVPIYFEAYTMQMYHKKDLYIVLTYGSGECKSFKDCDISKQLNEQYDNMNIDPQTLTADYLSKASKIIALNLTTTPLNVPWVVYHMSFVDETGAEFKVDQNVIESYNNTL